MIREGLGRVGPLGPWGQLGPWPWALAPGPPIITSERDQLHGLLLHGRLLLFEKNTIFVWEVCNSSVNECLSQKEYDQRRSVQGRGRSVQGRSDQGRPGKCHKPDKQRMDKKGSKLWSPMACCVHFPSFLTFVKRGFPHSETHSL